MVNEIQKVDDEDEVDDEETADDKVRRYGDGRDTATSIRVSDNTP